MYETTIYRYSNRHTDTKNRVQGPYWGILALGCGSTDLAKLG